MNIDPSQEANKLFKAYFLHSFKKKNINIDEMTSILLSTTNNIQPSILIQSFIDLCSQYFGNIISSRITPNSINDIAHIKYCLFHAALLTNSTIIIDAIMPYINYDFTTLNIPNDTTDEIFDAQMMNGIKSSSDSSVNCILEAIVDATTNGHYQSITHLINNYQLSPTIPIYDHTNSYLGLTNLLYYTTFSNNLQLIEYFLQFNIIESTNQLVLTQLIFNIAACGHLDLIKRFKDEYNVNLEGLEHFTTNILIASTKSNNIELVTYLIDIIGMDPRTFDLETLLSAIRFHSWDIVKLLCDKYHVENPPNYHPLLDICKDTYVTPDIIDYLISKFNINHNIFQHNPQQNSPTPLFELARSCNINAMKHIISKYNADPHIIHHSYGSLFDTVISAYINDPLKLPLTLWLNTIEYVYELGVDNDQMIRSINTLISKPTRFGQDILPIFQLMLAKMCSNDEYKFKTEYYIWQFASNLLYDGFWLEFQHLVQVFNLTLDNTTMSNLSYRLRGRTLFDWAIGSYSTYCVPSSQFISYLISTGNIDVNEVWDDGYTPIKTALSPGTLNFDIIKLLINNGAKVTINDWVEILYDTLSRHISPYDLFKCLDYFKDTFGWDIETANFDDIVDNDDGYYNNGDVSFNLMHHVFFLSHFNLTTHNECLIYRAFVHRYKANINVQGNLYKLIRIDDGSQLSTELINSFPSTHLDLLKFSISHNNSYQLGSFEIDDGCGTTFLHQLVSRGDIELQHIAEIEDILDAIIEHHIIK